MKKLVSYRDILDSQDGLKGIMKIKNRFLKFNHFGHEFGRICTAAELE